MRIPFAEFVVLVALCFMATMTAVLVENCRPQMVEVKPGFFRDPSWK